METGGKTVCVELRSLSHKIFRCVENLPSKKMIDSVTGTNGWIIGYLSHNQDKDIFQKDIEKEFGITRSTASKVIDLMEQKGLIERQKVSYDARLKKLILTEKSKKISAMMNEDMSGVEKQLIRGFTQQEIETLIEYIERMKNNLNTETQYEKEE
jgi:DNA-binding MarR family transcriptional regulator